MILSKKIENYFSKLYLLIDIYNRERGYCETWPIFGLFGDFRKKILASTFLSIWNESAQQIYFH